MSTVNWTFINEELARKHTSWINTLNKAQLVIVSDYFKLVTHSASTVNDLRKNLNSYFKEAFIIETCADSKIKTNATTQALKEQENVNS